MTMGECPYNEGRQVHVPVLFLYVQKARSHTKEGQVYSSLETTALSYVCLTLKREVTRGTITSVHASRIAFQPTDGF